MPPADDTGSVVTGRGLVPREGIRWTLGGGGGVISLPPADDTGIVVAGGGFAPWDGMR